MELYPLLPLSVLKLRSALIEPIEPHLSAKPCEPYLMYDNLLYVSGVSVSSGFEGLHLPQVYASSEPSLYFPEEPWSLHDRSWYEKWATDFQLSPLSLVKEFLMKVFWLSIVHVPILAKMILVHHR